MMLLAAIVQPTIEKAHRAIDEVQRVRNFKICLSCVYLCVSNPFMKTLINIAIFIFIFSSCKQTENKTVVADTSKKWTENAIKKYFRDSIAHRMYNGQMGQGDSLNNFDKFSKYILADIKAKNIDDPFILGFDENYIDTTKIDSSKKWFRISVNPCFRIPYCLIIEKFDNTSNLTLKMTDGHGGYYSGFVNFVSTQQDTDSLYSVISSKLHQLNFWKLKQDTTCGLGLDGETWTFEAIENGQYNIVSRWVPLHCGNDTTRQLALLGVDLRNKLMFKNYIQAKTEMTKKEIEQWYPDK